MEWENMISDKKVLNKEQLQAIKFGKGPLLIIAGAGTGKTTVITERIKHLIASSQAKPVEILALTFTEKASSEMEERIDKIMPYGYTQMWISTFHSFCDRILRDEAIHIGLNSHYVLMTEAESILFIRKNLYKFDLEYFRPSGNPNKFLNGLVNHFSRLKDEDLEPEDYLAYAKNLQAKLLISKSQLPINNDEIKKNLELAKAYQMYEELKIKEGVMDFGDLISNTLKLFRLRNNILYKYQDKFKYILVDEFQDTNYSQNELVILLAGKKANLTAVADDDQAIYRWRGAAISNVLQFRKIYQKAKIITLTKNYRSTQEILNRSYDLIQKNNPDRLEIKEKINKKLIAVRNLKGGEIKFLAEERVENEAEAVVKEIEKLVNINKRPGLSLRPGLYSHSDIAILVRANNHSDAFTRSLIRHSIPFQFLGPGRLFKQEEVKDLIAYLKVLYHFEDNVAFFRILSMPIFNLMARDVAALRNYAKKSNISFFEAAENYEKIAISSASKDQLKKIINMIHRHLSLMPKETAGQILYYFLEDTGILKQLADYKSQKDEVRAQNIAKFFDKLKSYEAEHEDASVEATVDWINLKMEMGESPLAGDSDWVRENKVNILTIHGAKGLEFPVVFMVNLVSDRFPTRERKEQIPVPEELIKEILPIGDYHEQEERRLFYVAMTRARDLLYFTGAKFYGEGKRVKKISPFVFEALGKQVLPELKQVKTNQTSIFDFRPVEKSSSIIHHPSSIKITYLSYSQIESFKRCPLQYKYQTIIGIPVPANSAASFGISIHNALKNYYQLIIDGKNPTKDKLLNLLKECWQNQGYSSKAHENAMFKKGIKMLENYYHKTCKIMEKPISVEQKFTIKISDLKVGGRIDRIDDLGKGVIEIIDYKTGKIVNQKDADKSIQMSIYSLAGIDPWIFKKKLNEVKLSFYFLDACEKVTTKRTKLDLEKVKKEILKIAEEIEISDFLPKPNRYCDFCNYKLLCPAWQ